MMFARSNIFINTTLKQPKASVSRVELKAYVYNRFALLCINLRHLCRYLLFVVVYTDKCCVSPVETQRGQRRIGCWLFLRPLTELPTTQVANRIKVKPTTQLNEDIC